MIEELTVRERATVLAALRYWQIWLPIESDCPERYVDIATDGGGLEPLSEEEVDSLIEKLNFGE